MSTSTATTLITARPPERRYGTTLAEVDVIDDPQQVDQAWRMYLDAFGPLAELAMQKHVMDLDEFAEVLADARITKYTVTGEDGQLIGLGTFTNHLAAVPLISPAFFRRRWPKLFRKGKVWYVGFVATSRCGRMTSPAAFADIISAMFHRATGGVVGLDMCTHTLMVKHLDRAVQLLLARTVGATPAEQVDAQHYFIFDRRPVAE